MEAPDGSGWLPSGVAMVIGIIGAVISYVRSITRADVQIDALNKRTDAVDKKIEAILADMKEERAKLTESIDAWGRNVGEGIAAVRQKIEITDMDLKRAELWNRDNFVRGTEFTQLRTSIEQALDRIDDKLDRMREGIEERIDSIRTTPS